MGLNADRIAAGLERLKQSDARFAEAAALHGLPEPRIRAPGYETLLRAIISQQVSTAAAASATGFDTSRAIAEPLCEPCASSTA